MEYNLKTLAIWINNFETTFNHDQVQEEKIAHWLHGLMDSELQVLINYLTPQGVATYNRYFKNK